jgi:hypothetical protein
MNLGGGVLAQFIDVDAGHVDLPDPFLERHATHEITYADFDG